MDGEEFKFQDPNNEEEEVEEALSLCDLPLYSDDASASDKYEINNGHDRFSKDEQSWSSMDQRKDLFEFSFSSEEFSSSRHYGDNIIFCGKLITCKVPLVLAKKQHEIPSNNKKKKNNKKTTNNNHHKEKRRRFFRWRFHVFTWSRTPSNKLKVEAKSKSHTDGLARVTAMKCRARCRWHFFMFGLARFPLEMELHDIKTRQDRRCPSSFMFRRPNGDGKINEKQRNWGLWRLLKTLSCIGYYSNANALVNSSYGCIVRE